MPSRRQRCEMRDYLVLSLVAPMGAFGDIAGHEWRGTYQWPGRSAILGLIGAALGVRRYDRVGQTALADWCTAVSVLSVGDIWRDFHTVQSVPSSRIKRPATRSDAIKALKPNDNGLITCREYMSDCAFGVALWGGEMAPLKSALEKPKFAPYLGRKSCPLSAPMAPRKVRSGDVIGALAQIKLPDFLNLEPDRPILIASEEDIHSQRVETRWDDPIDRVAWHFGPRQVFIQVSESHR